MSQPTAPANKLQAKIAGSRLQATREELVDALQGRLTPHQHLMLRLQLERMQGSYVPSLREYFHFFGLDYQKLAAAKPDALIMHPGPMNRGVEIDTEVADDIDRSLIRQQVEMGVAVRMAVLDILSRRDRRND